MSTQNKQAKRNKRIFKNLRINPKFIEMVKNMNSTFSIFNNGRSRTRNHKDSSIAKCRSINDSSRNAKIFNSKNKRTYVMSLERNKKINLPCITQKKGRKINSPIQVLPPQIRVRNPIAREQKNKNFIMNWKELTTMCSEEQSIVHNKVKKCIEEVKLLKYSGLRLPRILFAKLLKNKNNGVTRIFDQSQLPRSDHESFNMETVEFLNSK